MASQENTNLRPIRGNFAAKLGKDFITESSEIPL